MQEAYAARSTHKKKMWRGRKPIAAHTRLAQKQAESGTERPGGNGFDPHFPRRSCMRISMPPEPDTASPPGYPCHPNRDQSSHAGRPEQPRAVLSRDLARHTATSGKSIASSFPDPCNHPFHVLLFAFRPKRGISGWLSRTQETPRFQRRPWFSLVPPVHCSPMLT
ncbi:hypothetical protein DPMN_061173 [Dreissena polymorpha]|uniref:Uncharacterized protein n=1 Tax=Dreissena polymorpha TaxID=45954 RepID=A0A9D4HGN4_DREPO|nr:hypothetical protein DPMN_061173 [Dreissena polymorpha]